MPRESKDINYFNKGMITSQDSADIPDDASPYSLNVENESEEGKLVGRVQDVFRTPNNGSNILKAAIIRKTDGTRDIVAHGQGGGASEAIRLIQNFGETSEAETTLLTLPALQKLSLVTHNQEVHIGMGSADTTPPKWAGYTKSDSFHGAGQNVFSLVDAELKFPKTFPTLEKIVLSSTHIFGYELAGDRLYKIDRSTGEQEFTSPGIITEIRAICEDSDSNYIWVHDIGASTYGTLKKVKKADLTVESYYTLNAPPNADFENTYVSDIVATTGFIWIARHNPSIASINAVIFSAATPVVTVSNHWLYRVDKTTTVNTSVTPAEITPDILAPCQFYIKKPAGLGGTYVTQNLYIQETFKFSFFRISSTKIGWMLRSAANVHYQDAAVNPTVDFYSDTYYDNGSAKNAVHTFAFVLTDTSVVNTSAPIIRFDNNNSQRGYTGFWYDTSADKLYVTHPSRLIIGTAMITVPTMIAPTDFDASSGRIFGTTNYNEAVTAQDTDLFMTRLPGNENGAGVDKIDTTLTTETEVFGGGLVTIVNTASGPDSFSEHTKYYYKVCFKYDGYQHSPLTDSVLLTITNGAGVKSSTIPKVTVLDVTKVSPRVSAICIFRARSSDSDPHPTEFYRIVKEIALSDVNWVVTANKAEYTFSDDIEDVGVSYEQASGMPETLITSMVNYELSTSLNSQLFVAKCYKKELTDASHYIFKSKVSRFDMIDWTTDFVKLPIIPTALAAYAGRLWVFDKDICYMVNPETLTVDEVFHGVGADNERCVLVTDQGLFCCNKINIWVNANGRLFEPIGEAVRTKSSTISEAVSWKDVAHTMYDPFILLNTRRHSVQFHVSQGATNADYAFVFHYLKNRWDYWQFAVQSVFQTSSYYTGGFTDVDGTVYYSNIDKLRGVNTATTRSPFTFYTKRFSFDETGQPKKLYKFRVEGTATPTITYALDGSGTFGGSLTPPNFPTADKKLKSVQFKIVVADHEEIRSIELVFRHMIGKR